MTLLQRTIIIDAVNATTSTSSTNTVAAGTALPLMMGTIVVAKEQRERGSVVLLGASNRLAILMLTWCFEKLPDALKNFDQYFLVPTQYFPLRVTTVVVDLQ